MRIPRPDRTAALGAPNACAACHADKGADWAVETLKKWNPTPNPGAQGFAEAFALAESDGVGAREALLGVAGNAALPAIARASALDRLARAPTQKALAAAEKSLADPDPVVRMAAVSMVATADAATRRQYLAPLLEDRTRLVRMEAARALAGEPEQGLSPSQRAAFDKALAEYVAAEQFNAERPESQTNLGGLYLERGQPQAARAAYERAIAIDPSFVPAAVALAELARGGGDEAAAQAILQKSFSVNPKSGELAHALGLSLIRQKRLPEALAKLREAAALDPNDARYAYVYAIALHDTGRKQAAMDALRAALARQPNDRDILSALANYEVQDGDFAAALVHVETLAKLEPDNAQIRRFLAALKGQAR